MNVVIVAGCFGTLQIKYSAFVTSEQQNIIPRLCSVKSVWFGCFPRLTFRHSD